MSEPPFVVLKGLLFLSFLMVAEARALEPLTDEQMTAVAGYGTGVMLTLGYHINATYNEATDQIIKTPCVSLPDSQCRLALGIAGLDANRDVIDSGATGGWLVLKDYYASFQLNNVYVDAGRTDSVASPYLASGPFAANPAASQDKPAIELTVAPGRALDTATYGDATLFYNLGRLTAEFDGGGKFGYMNNNVTGAPISMRMQDASSTSAQLVPAQMRFDGTMKMFGFGY